MLFVQVTALRRPPIGTPCVSRNFLYSAQARRSSVLAAQSDLRTRLGWAPCSRRLRGSQTRSRRPCFSGRADPFLLCIWAHIPRHGPGRATCGGGPGSGPWRGDRRPVDGVPGTQLRPPPGMKRPVFSAAPHLRPVPGVPRLGGKHAADGQGVWWLAPTTCSMSASRAAHLSRAEAGSPASAVQRARLPRAVRVSGCSAPKTIVNDWRRLRHPETGPRSPSPSSIIRVALKAAARGTHPRPATGSGELRLRLGGHTARRGPGFVHQQLEGRQSG